MKCIKEGTEIESNDKKSLGPNNQISGKLAAIRTDIYKFWDHLVDGESNVNFF
jgi:hypothetical protein